MDRVKELEQKIGYVFKDKSLIERALMHSSYTNEKHLKKYECNERLEFLGDAVLELVSSAYLFNEFPKVSEGELTKTRASMVCEPSLAMCARDIVGKLFACFFTIMLFVVAGYEHCIANMYYIPAGLIAARNQNYVQMAMDTYGYTADQLASLNLYGFFVKNLVPVTIGNIIGGAVLGLILLYLHGYDKKKAA